MQLSVRQIVTSMACASVLGAQTQMQASSGAGMPRQWRLSRESVAIGESHSQDLRYVFTGINGAIEIAGRRLLISDATRTLRVFDSLGQYLSAFGRSGQGPGEFTWITEVRRVVGDSILVADRSGRVSVFSSNGELGRLYQRRTYTGPVVAALWDGSVVARTPTEQAVSVVEGYTIFSGRLKIVGRDGTTERELLVPNTYREAMTVRRPVFPPKGYVAAGRDLIFHGFSLHPRISVVNARAEIVRVIDLPWEPARMRGDALETYVRGYLSQFADADERAGSERYIRRGSRTISRFPAFSQIMGDAENNVWVRHYRLIDGLIGPARMEYDEPKQWSVFSSSGIHLAEITTPSALTLTDIGADYVVGIWRDADGVQSVRRHALIKN